jgi:hypothetical protein
MLLFLAATSIAVIHKKKSFAGSLKERLWMTYKGNPAVPLHGDGILNHLPGPARDGGSQ